MNKHAKYMQNNQTRLLLLVVIVLLLNSTNSSSQIRTPIESDPFSSSSGLANTSTNAVHAFTNTQQRADRLYASGTYQTAFHIYELLAELGDKYSQYRVAFMYEQAQGIEHNLLQAYAWSKVAAEAGHGPLIEYHQHIHDLLTEAQLPGARDLAIQYLTSYGLAAQAYNARLAIREELRKCTGSRLGTRCDRVTSRGITCGITNDGVPDLNCLKLGSVGVPSVMGAQPLDIRKIELTLRDIMDQYNPGTVELRELELIDADVEAPREDENQ
ncbi:MAG: hypothetical protein PF630_11245 [Gammaproteobacteria bacterium]|jgi:hypothetical protein|nr:hypothetical protein [Gammaproteobacteria bacterium]